MGDLSLLLGLAFFHLFFLYPSTFIHFGFDFLSYTYNLKPQVHFSCVVLIVAFNNAFLLVGMDCHVWLQ